MRTDWEALGYRRGACWLARPDSVTGGIHDALARAREAARGQDVRVGGGVETVRRYLKAGLIDEIHLAMAPTLLGGGKALLTGIDMTAAGFRCTQHVSTRRAMHVVLTKGQGVG